MSTHQNKRSSSSSNWSIDLLRIQGIPIRIHLSFFLLLAWIAIEESKVHGDVIGEIIFVSLIFLCVLLHELGHALTALKFNIKTRDIILYPFGGIASLLGEAAPKGELLIAIAGPLVNVALALLIFPFTSLYKLPNDVTDSEVLNLLLQFNVLDRLFVANVVLAVFNMIPAYPMDGGRVLRAFLSLIGLKSGPVIAYRLSQVISICMGGLAIYYGNLILGLIALLVFSYASNEQLRFKAKAAWGNLNVYKIMDNIGEIASVPHGLTNQEAYTIIEDNPEQEFFPVLYGDNVIGVVDRLDVLKSLAASPEPVYLAEIMHRTFPKIEGTKRVDMAWESFQSGLQLPLMVNDSNGKIVGLLTREKLLGILLGGTKG